MVDSFTKVAYLGPNYKFRYMKNLIVQCAEKLGNTPCAARTQVDMQIVHLISKLVSQVHIYYIH